MKTSSRPGTSLVLIMLTLITGVALGWLFRDLLGMPRQQAGAIAATAAPATQIALPSATPQPSPTALPTATELPISTTAPTTAPTREPTAVPVPTDEPTVTPVPTNRPTATATPQAPTTAQTSPDSFEGQQIAGFAGHKLAEGETLADLAARG
ncbi:MAG TPA: hypothetical protein VFT99_08550, partial [Roseiflexaceae bacterium]|nr:hypothetical protein [Roseiflexaceae bacterium]